MLDKIINNFCFNRSLYIIAVVALGIGVINDLKDKDKIEIKEYLNHKTININRLLKYLFLSFIVRIILEQAIIYIQVPTTDVQVPSTILEIFFEFLATCIFAPIFEEIIFRFGLYKIINKKFNVLISILVTSIIFAVIHNYNIDGFIILLGISLIWHYSFYKTNNLIYPMLLHFFHNIYALINNVFNYNKYWFILLFINILGIGILAIEKQKN